MLLMVNAVGVCVFLCIVFAIVIALFAAATLYASIRIESLSTHTHTHCLFVCNKLEKFVKIEKIIAMPKEKLIEIQHEVHKFKMNREKKNLTSHTTM